MSKAGVKYLDEKELLTEIIKIQNDPNADKTKFATQCMLIIENLRKRPQFSGYTTNWTEDYISNSIYKMLKYIHNFDHTRISKITNEPVSAFAYLTQIAKAAFYEVINKRKKESSYIKETIQYQELENLVQRAQKTLSHMSREEEKTVYEEDVKEYNLRKLSIDGQKFEDLTSLLQHIWDLGERKIKVIYPKKYTISLEEYERIKEIGNFEYLNLTRKTYNQKKKVVEDEEEEEILITDIDEWSDSIEESLND